MPDRSGRALRIVLVLKTSEGGTWAVPHVEELRRRGHEVVAVLPAGPGRLRSALGRLGVPVVDSPFDFRFRPRWSTVAGLLALRRQLRELAPDVLHYHLYASALAARLAGLGGPAARVHMVAGPLYLDSPVIRLAERALVRLDTVTIAGSAHTGARYRALGRPGRLVPVIPYGVDTEHHQPVGPEVRERVRREVGAGPDAVVAVMVAYVYAPKRSVHAGRGVKGHDVVLRAWQRYRIEHPGSRLVLVGAGFDAAGEEHRRQLIAEFGLDRPGSGVTWIPTTTDVRPYYAAADVSVSPSRSENHGAALEAGAMAVPSIVSDAGALPETVDSGSGWVVRSGDVDDLLGALRSAAAEHRDGRLAARGARARALVRERFDRGRAARAVADVIEAAAAGRREFAPPSTLPVTLFAEARIGRDPTGHWSATDRANGPAAWTRYQACGLRLAVRADPRPGSGQVPLPPDVAVGVLPHYVGLAGLLRASPRLAAAVTREVRTAERVVLRVPGAVGTAAAAACRLLRRRYAVEVVGDPAAVLASGVLGPAGRRAARPAGAAMRWVVTGADASSFVTSRALQAAYPPAAGTRTAATSCVRLDPAAFVPGPRRFPEGRGACVVTVGSQEQHYKGHDVLLRAVRRLVDDGLPVRAVVVGGGRLHDALVAQAAGLGLADEVHFTGALHDREAVVARLDAATVFALPSRTEGLPRALLEAMARALPAVGTAVGGVPELLDASCLVPVDDAAALAAALRDLLTDPVRWEAQSARNLEVARSYAMADLDRRFADWLASVPPARAGRG